MKRPWGAVALVVVGLAACGAGGGDAASAGGVERYCEMSDRLDEASDALINTGTNTDEEISRGFATLISDHGDDLDALVAAAPAEIKSEVAKGVEAFHKAAVGDFSAMQSFDETKISDYDAEHCP